MPDDAKRDALRDVIVEVVDPLIRGSLEDSRRYATLIVEHLAQAAAIQDPVRRGRVLRDAHSQALALAGVAQIRVTKAQQAALTASIRTIASLAVRGLIALPTGGIA